MDNNVDKKVEDNLRLVFEVIHKHMPNVINQYFKGDREEVISIAMFGLFKACKSYEEKRGKFYAYATKCIKNEILYEIRRLKSYKDRAISEAYSIEELIQDDSTASHKDFLIGVADMEDDIVSKILIMSVVEKARMKLSKSRKTLLDLKLKYGDIKASELARVMNKPRQAVTKQLFEVRKILKHQLEEESK